MIIRFIRSKKGFEIAFNWIFVLFAGFVILMFFFTFMRNQYSTVKIEESAKSQSDAQFIFAASQGSRNSEKIISFPAKISFSCDDGVSHYLVGDSNVFNTYNHLAIFTPAYLQKSDFIVKTQSFDAPFSVMPVTFITNKRVRYVFIDSSTPSDSSIAKLMSSLPKNATKSKITEINNFKNDNYDLVIFIVNNKKTPSSQSSVIDSSFKESDYPNVFLVTYEFFDDTETGAGKLNFYKYESSGFIASSGSFFLNDLQLTGAIYSGSEVYSCQFDKMLDKLKLISSLHRERTVEIQTNFIGTNCESLYGNLISHMSNIESKIEDGNFNDQKIKSLFESINGIITDNKKIVRDTSCPPIY